MEFAKMELATAKKDGMEKLVIKRFA